MKKVIYYIIIGVFITSCSKDYLNEDIKSNITAEELYLTEDGYEGLVNANYSLLRNIYGQDPYMFCSGTDLYADGKQTGPVGLTEYSSLTAAAEGVGQLYTSCYDAIQKANLALYYSDLTAPAEYINNRIGELKYLRANAYFLLVQTYGGVGLVTDYINTPTLEFERNSAEEVYSFIVNELEESLALVSNEAFTGRVNKRAVRHLLAKVHLTRGYENFADANDFATAATYADAAIAGQTLNLPFEELWSPDNSMNEEVLFSVQFSLASVSASPTTLGHKQSNFFGPYMGGAEVAGDAPYKTETLVVTQQAIDLFTQDDERWYTTFMSERYNRYYDYYDVEDHSGLEVVFYYAPEWASSDPDLALYQAAHPTAVIYPYGTYAARNPINEDNGTIPLRKFDDPTAPFASGNAATSTRDLILSRLGETYLIAAEAYLQSGSPGTGLQRLNVVRNRAGVIDATLGEFDIDYILEERGRELLGEYHRWFDLKRTGKLVEYASMYNYQIETSNFNGASGELKILRPIPQSALDLNQNKSFPQNPAYN